MNSLWKAPTHSILKGVQYQFWEHSNIVKLIERDAEKRFKLAEIKAHPFFSGVCWDALLKKEIPPPFKPMHGKDPHDVSNFDTMYTSQTGKSFSPATVLSRSQNELFANFSYAREFTPTGPGLSGKSYDDSPSAHYPGALLKP